MYRPIYFLFMLLSAYAFNAQANPTVPFSASETDWIAAHPVVQVAYQSDYAPFTFFKDGSYQGLATSYLNFVAQISGIKFVPVPYAEMKESFVLKDLTEKKIEVFAATASSPVSMKLNYPLIYTTPFYKGNSVIVTRPGDFVIPQLLDLFGKTLAVRGGGAYERLIRKNYPDIRFLGVDSQEEALQAVADGRADAALGLDTVLVPIIRHRYEGRLNVSGVAADVPVKLSIAVRRDLPELASIIDKSLAMMTAQQRDDLADKWLYSGDYGTPKWAALLRYYVLELASTAAVLILLAILAFRERYSKERAARSERKMAMFLAVMSHEIRSPLNAIISSVELLQEKPLNAATQDILAVAGTASESLLNLLNDLLDFSKLEAQRLELVAAPCDLSTLVQNAIDLSMHKAQAKGLYINVKIDAPPHCRVVVDAARVRQILVNLLSNAIKFSDDGAIYLLATFDITDGANGVLSVSVVDMGIGISVEEQTHLFQPFSQAKDANAHHRGGSGLGLSICRELLTLMGGTIELRSTLALGTTVSFTLPCQIEVVSHLGQHELLPV